MKIEPMTDMRQRQDSVEQLGVSPSTQTELSQPNASAHLACLAECGLVARERRRKFVYYAIADKRVVRVLEEAEAILTEVGAHIFRCTS